MPTADHSIRRRSILVTMTLIAAGVTIPASAGASPLNASTDTTTTFTTATSVTVNAASTVTAPDVALTFDDSVAATATAPPPPPKPATPTNEEGQASASRDYVRQTISAAPVQEAAAAAVDAGVAVTTGDAAVVAEAEKYLGVPYVWGGTTPSGFDCSGLVQYVYAQLGIALPRTSEEQYEFGTLTTSPVPGDIVHYSGHVGIYIGNSMMIHAPKPGDVVTVASIWGSPEYVHVS